jgi:predicted transcriptional regulator
MLYIMNRTNIYLPDAMLKRLRELAEKSGLSVAEIVRRALDEYLLRQK